MNPVATLSKVRYELQIFLTLKKVLDDILTTLPFTRGEGRQDSAGLLCSLFLGLGGQERVVCLLRCIHLRLGFSQFLLRYWRCLRRRTQVAKMFWLVIVQTAATHPAAEP